MSQHYFRPIPSIVILMGWDRPLQGFYLVIEQADNDDDTVIYSNLEDPNLQELGGMSSSLDYLLARIVDLKLNVPQAMINEIRADAAHNIGSRSLRWNEQGVEVCNA